MKKIITMLLISILFFVLLFILDYKNIPSEFANKEINIELWINIISTTMGVVVAGLISVYVAYVQIVENKKIEMLPLLEYQLGTSEIIDCKQVYLNTIYDRDSHGTNVEILLNIKNLGNNIREIFLEIHGNEVKRQKVEFNQKILESNKLKQICFNALFKIGNKEKMYIDVYYTDMLQNKYIQKIEIEYETTNIISSFNKREMIISINVNQEEEYGKRSIKQIKKIENM